MAAVMFYILAALIIIGAILFLRTDRLVYALLFSLMIFLSLAGLYLLLDAPFVAMSQVLIYAGAIIVLITFVVMLTVGNRPVEGEPRNKLIPAIASIGLFIILFITINSTKWVIAKNNVFKGTDYLARQIFTTYRLPFELAGVLLLAAVIGAVYLAKEESSD